MNDIRTTLKNNITKTFLSICCIILFVVIVMLTYFYDHIHDLLTTSRSKKKQQNIEHKITTSSKSLLKIEFKKYFSSKGYLMNTIVGGILCIVMVGIMLSTLLTNEDPEFVAIIKDIVPYLSLMIMWCIGISTPAASAISMEGKSFWIIKTLPIDYKKYLKCYIQKKMESLIEIEFEEDPLISLLSDSAFEREKDITRGGAVYNNLGLTSVGLGTVVTSLLNLKQFVFESKEYSLQELNEYRKNNYVNQEEVWKKRHAQGYEF